jgi:hypothetical protein
MRGFGDRYRSRKFGTTSGSLHLGVPGYNEDKK